MDMVVVEVQDGASLRLPSPIEIVKDEARLQGFLIDDHVADYVLWEETGWPGFWRRGDGQTTEECLRTHSRKFFESSAWRRG